MLTDDVVSSVLMGIFWGLSPCWSGMVAANEGERRKYLLPDDPLSLASTWTWQRDRRVSKALPWLSGVLLVVLVAAGLGRTEWRENATFGWNRIPEIVRELAGECPGGQVHYLVLEKRNSVVGCVQDGKEVLHYWSSGRRREQVLRLREPSLEPFTLDDIDLDQAAKLVARGDTSALRIRATQIRGVPGVKIESTSGAVRELTPRMLPR